MMKDVHHFTFITSFGPPFPSSTLHPFQSFADCDAGDRAVLALID